MGINYDVVRPLDAYPTGRVEEHNFRQTESIVHGTHGTSLVVLMRYPVFVSQIVASWGSFIFDEKGREKSATHY